MRRVIYLISVSLISACATAAPTPIIMTATPPESSPTPKVVILTATEDPLPPTPTPSPEPSATLMPDYCYQDPSHFVSEIERIGKETDGIINYWNNSARTETVLIEVEVMFRDRIDQTRSLRYPDDFQVAYEYFLAGMEGILHAVFGITDWSDEHRTGNIASYQEAFQLHREAMNAAFANREFACREYDELSRPVAEVGQEPTVLIGESWDFESNAEGWTPTNHLQPFTFADGILVTSTSGDDPYLISPSIRIDASKYQYIEINMRLSDVDTGWGFTGVLEGAIYFITDQDNSYNEDKRVAFPTFERQFREYRIDMSASPAWQGTIRQIRLDPLTGQADIQIDYIRIVAIN